MKDFKEIINRANIQEIRLFLLNGVDLSTWRGKPDPDSYNERIRKGETPLWKFVETLYPDGNERDDVCGLVCQAISVNQEVYMELGIILGAKLFFEFIQSDIGLQGKD